MMKDCRSAESGNQHVYRLTCEATKARSDGKTLARNPGKKP